MDDLISRQEAIYAVNTALFPKINTAKDAEKALRNLPSAQPETHEERTETHACDLISRQAAIDAIKGLPTWWADEGGYYGGAQPPMKALLDPTDAVSAIENLPSAQPEIVQCNDCKNRGDDDCPMRFIEWVEYDDDGYIEYDDIIHDFTKDDGFCDRAERREE